MNQLEMGVTHALTSRKLLLYPEAIEFAYDYLRSSLEFVTRDAGRVVVWPSVRVTEGPDEVMDGTRITIRAITVPVEAV